MPQVLKQPVVTKVVTKEGECIVTIALELNINLHTLGAEVVAKPQDQVQAQAQPAVKEEKESIDWMMPDLQGIEKIKFGKIVGE